MPRQISINEIIEAILTGYTTAQVMHEQMSGGWWLWKAPEYFITTSVAQSIFNLDSSKFITLEHGSTSALEDAGAKGRGRLPNDVREKGKVDLLLWWANETPRAIIEIKNQIYSKEQYDKDIKRIRSFLQRNSHKSSLQFGVFAFYESASSGLRKTAEEKIVGRTNRIFENTKSMLGADFKASLYTTNIHNELEENAWLAACILIKQKNT